MAKTTGSWSDVICTVPALMRSIGGGIAAMPLASDTVEDHPLPADATYTIIRCLSGAYIAYKFKSIVDTDDAQYYNGGPFLDFVTVGNTNIEKIPVGATAISLVTGDDSSVTISFR